MYSPLCDCGIQNQTLDLHRKDGKLPNKHQNIFYIIYRYVYDVSHLSNTSYGEIKYYLWKKVLKRLSSFYYKRK